MSDHSDTDTRVSSADLVRNFAPIADKARLKPVTVTQYGRDHLVLLSVEEYQRLKRRDRKVLRIPEDLDETTIEAIRTAEVPPGNEHLDKLLPPDWKP